jgi:long-chain acyl-CoA synthetase
MALTNGTEGIDPSALGRETLAEMFDRVAGDRSDAPAQQYKGGVSDRSLADAGAIVPAPDGRYKTLTYREYSELVERLSAGFGALGVADGDRVAIMSGTRMEWAQVDFAVLAANGVVTTVYRDAADETVAYLLSDPGATGAVVEDATALERVLSVAPETDLEWVATIEAVDAPADPPVAVYTLGEVYRMGQEAFDPESYEQRLAAREPTDLATLVYTSGTTGRPKGVRLTHRNVKANVEQNVARYGDPDREGPTVDADDRSLSYLPLAHIFERTVGHFAMVEFGGTVAYAESVDTLREDLQAVAPTLLTSVPRVYERLYDTMRERAAESTTKRRIFEWATGVSEAYHESGGGLLSGVQYGLADRLVFSDVREALGGNVDLLISGGGTLSPELSELYRGMGLTLCEGYGLTEAAPVVTSQPPEDVKQGTIGTPLPGVEVDIDRSVVPERDHTDSFGVSGELLVRGPNVFDGYWNDPEATEAAFTDDGWFRTGDVVLQRPDDHFVFRERAKQLLVLSTGKNVAPAPIEDAFATEESVEQVLVLGDGRKFVSALIVPNLEWVREWADGAGVDLPEDDRAVCRDDRVHDRIGETVARVNESFDSHERIKTFRLVPDPFTTDNDLLTPTMKKKRPAILDRWNELVEAMYAAD